jgi:hypothetical protein
LRLLRGGASNPAFCSRGDSGQRHTVGFGGNNEVTFVLIEGVGLLHVMRIHENFVKLVRIR